MLRKRFDLFLIFLIAIASLFLVFDLFTNKGQPATFDGTIHITTIAQFYRGLSEGEHRVMWADGFANYGMPIPIISQQSSPYMGALLNFMFKDVLFSYNLIYLIGAILSSVFYYIFLRIYFKQFIAFTGAFLFNFAPYRIINLYIRGAQPEFFAGVFIPLILIGIYLTSKNKNYYGIPLLIFSCALLILTHPFMFVVGLFLFVPYIIFCVYNSENKIEFIFQTIISIGLGIGLTAFYTIPAFFETKYFYLGSEKNHLAPNQFLGFANYIDPNWYYFYKNDVFVRGNFIKADLLETSITATGLILLIASFIRKRREDLLTFSVITSFILIFFTISLSSIFYEKISILNTIQFPWRMLSSLMFVTPLILCMLLKRAKYQNLTIGFVIIVIILLRFPQLYGKNYTVYPQSKYFFTSENLHSNMLNTIWTGKTSEYPIKKQKGEIISGSGMIINRIVKNSSREYQIKALTDIRMVDYTFYFPGWRVYVDGAKAPIQYQDPSYRGVITYNVPKGNHQIILKFENTIDRIVGYLISIISILAIPFVLYVTRKDSAFLHFAFPKAWRK